MEILDIYSADHRRTGRTVERNGKVEPGDWLLVVHVCLFNSKGRMLMQKRQTTKDRYPGCWDLSAGGFVKSGEDSAQCAARELFEELGLRAGPEDLRFILTEPFSYVLDDFYLAFMDVEADSLCLQQEEVSEAAWVSWEELEPMLSDGRFVDYDINLMRRVFEKAEEFNPIK